MAAFPVFLGALELAGLEVPAFYDRGGTVQPIIHNLVGGGRVVQLIGPEPVRRRLQGCFTGADAADRAQLLEAMRDAGVPVPLAIGPWNEMVVVTRVVLRYAARGSIVQYLLDAEPLAAAPAASADSAASILAGIASDLGAAIGFAMDGQTEAVLSGAGSALASGSSDIAASAIADASAALAATATSSGIALRAASPSAGSDLVADAGTLASATANAGILANAVGAGAYATRAAASLASLAASGAAP